MKKLKNILASVVFLFSSAANAIIISGDLTTAGGKSVDLGGLEWLSFDHIDSNGTDYSTFNKTHGAVAASDSIWTNDGWTFATGLQMNALYRSLGLAYPCYDISTNICRGYNPVNADGVSFLLDMWGSITYPEKVVYLGNSDGSVTKNTTSEITVMAGLYGDEYYRLINGELISYSAMMAFGDTNTQCYETNLRGTIVESWCDEYAPFANSSVRTRTADPRVDVGSFLVREVTVADIPEPPVIALLGAGLIGLSMARCRKQHGKSH